MNTYANHLIVAEATPNTKSSAIRCTGGRPCRRVTCAGCMRARREYFCDAVEMYSKRHQLNRHVTISWKTEGDHFLCLLNEMRSLGKSLSGQLGKFIRVGALGKEKATPHVHYLIVETAIEKLLKQVNKSHRLQRKYISEITEPYGLAGYLFDQNFKVTAEHPCYIKGTRLISGSRGISYGFPRGKNWHALEAAKRLMRMTH